LNPLATLIADWSHGYNTANETLTISANTKPIYGQQKFFKLSEAEIPHTPASWGFTTGGISVLMAFSSV